jgi:hypothetical protein
MISYEINCDTLALIPVSEKETKIIERNNIFNVNNSVMNIIENSCEYFGSSYLGRHEGTKKLIGITHKAPIIIEESKNLIYFPTTLEFIIVVILSIIISIYTLVKSKKTSLKVINVLVPTIISFLFFCIIENVNTLELDFNEFSVFTNSTLMSLHELAMGLFVSWIIGLILYRIDEFVINKAVNEVYEVDYDYKTVNALSIDEINNEDEELEMPKLKTN